MSSSQIAGNTSANIAEVEAATLALRTTLRAEDFGNLGIYSLGANSGIMAAGLAGGSTIFSFRWGNATNLALIKRFQLSAGNNGTAFAAGVAKFDLSVARSFSASDSGGNTLTPSANSGKMRTSMGASLVTDVRMSSTATLTAGTRTLDANPIGSLAAGVLATAGVGFVFPPVALHDVRPGEYPLVLAQNEGLVLTTTVPITGTWVFGIKIDWTEIAAY